MRAPFQVLVVPFRCATTGLEYAILKRSDLGWWQFVAGGGEDDETPLQAAERETKEEIGSSVKGRLIKLDSTTTIPKHNFAAAESWGPEVGDIPEYCFAVEVGDSALVLSDEHTEARWVSYEEACRLLMWDSNREAMGEVKDIEEARKALREGLTVSWDEFKKDFLQCEGFEKG